MISFRHCRPIFAVALAAAGAAAPLAAETDVLQHHRTSFSVRFGALPVGQATFDVRYNAQRYEVGTSGKTVGIAELVASGKGVADSQGVIDGTHIQALRHDVVYEEKNRKATLHMEFADGAVSKVDIVDPKKKNKTGPKWIQVTPEQLKAVLDPASSIIIPVDPARASDPHAVCDRTLPVYDGDTRFDIALDYKATKTVSTDGYVGYAYVCRLRYVPIAGHKRNQKNVEYMRKNSGMEIWLAPMEKTNLYTPIRVEVPTWVGTVVAVPTYFGPAS